MALALRICGDDEAKLSAIAVRAAALADDDQRSAALGEVARRGAPGAAFDACAKAGVAPPAAVAASVLDPLERALADQRDAGAPLRAAARLATLDDVGATRRCLLLAYERADRLGERSRRTRPSPRSPPRPCCWRSRFQPTWRACCRSWRSCGAKHF